ncbi:hypothetical protein SJI45_20710 [Streptomyces sp. S399]|uniref:hypothetical protein n=1 Tax=Streptomyces sp. S399 TaxID=3096009 RepID=UPI002A8260ED|nr:hypothetical protein [Streptomyces sp. S399]WPR53115.1 hypothetical protein SJI45_20710 [Streptomyces sp. S399]
MAFVLIGVLLIVLKLGGFVQFHKDGFWAWAIVLSPFGRSAGSGPARRYGTGHGPGAG